jgi:hypothetical protein
MSIAIIVSMTAPAPTATEPTGTAEPFTMVVPLSSVPAPPVLLMESNTLLTTNTVSVFSLRSLSRNKAAEDDTEEEACKEQHPSPFELGKHTWLVVEY